MFLKVTTKTNYDTGRTYLQLTKVGGETKNISAPFRHISSRRILEVMKTYLMGLRSYKILSLIKTNLDKKAK